MKAIADRRGEIYDYFHANSACRKYFYDDAHKEEYVAYYNSMHLLQDSTESLLQHRKRGFSTDPLTAYLEFWGVMQAAIIQQDSIIEIYEVIVRQDLNAKAKNLKSWLKVRELRIICAGHPVLKEKSKMKPLTRTFMGRAFGSYGSIAYEQWQQGLGTTHLCIDLGALLDAYALEAEAELATVLSAMKARWP
jgi:hypothetical protein